MALYDTQTPQLEFSAVSKNMTVDGNNKGRPIMQPIAFMS